MLDGHLYDLRLLYASPALLEVRGGDETGEVGQAVVHAVAATLLNDAVAHGILEVK